MATYCNGNSGIAFTVPESFPHSEMNNSRTQTCLKRQIIPTRNTFSKKADFLSHLFKFTTTFETTSTFQNINSSNHLIKLHLKDTGSHTRVQHKTPENGPPKYSCTRICASHVTCLTDTQNTWIMQTNLALNTGTLFETRTFSVLCRATQLKTKFVTCEVPNQNKVSSTFLWLLNARDVLVFVFVQEPQNTLEVLPELQFQFQVTTY